MLEDMSYLKKTYGVTSFSLVHDMYTVNRKKVIEFCQSLIESGEGFSWSCSARTDRIDEELIELMSAAGCEGIFFGIETGSRRLQKILKKNLDLEEAKKVIEKSSASGISTAVALITAFPDETIDDFRKTVHFFVDSLRYDGAEPQLSLLAPLAKTVLHTEYKDNLILDKMFSDMSHQGWSHDPRELEMIEGNPELFPNFYAIPTKHVGRPYFKEVHDFTVAIASWFRWVPVALLNDTGDFLNVFDRWKDWAIANGIDQSESYENIPYFFRRQFPKDFLLFVRSEGFKAIARRPDVVITVAEAEVFNFQKGDTPHPAERHDDSISMGSIPCLEERVHIIELGFDYREILRCLRNGLSFHSIPKKEVTIAFVKSSEQKVVVRELSGLTASLIKHCNGSKTIGEICQVANLSTAKQNKLPAKEKLIPFVMSRLNDQGLVFFRNAA
jgi:hypothetical protein